MLLESNLVVKPTWLLRETGNSALEADPRTFPNQKKLYKFILYLFGIFEKNIYFVFFLKRCLVIFPSKMSGCMQLQHGQEQHNLSLLQ